ncbi:Gfo/Idh/MocA family oxidoreductase [Nanoarchaeota archaeon]
MKTLNLGVIGLSEGNGHPYSWSAIFNGYNPEFMRNCPFPVIHDYLSKQKFPQDSIKEAKVTHIWTQDRAISEQIAKACYIENIANNFEDLIGKVDAVLLARDDAELHYKFSAPFLKAGIPVYIDKPLSYDVKTAEEIYSLEQYPNQIFTCSALAYAKEFQLSKEDLDSLGTIKYIDACVMKGWKNYSVHIIDPVLKIMGNPGKIKDIKIIDLGKQRRVIVFWESGIVTSFFTSGDLASPIRICLFGSKGFREVVFKDSFFAFKSALQHFIDVVLKRNSAQPKESVLNIIEIIERGGGNLG